MRIDDLDPQRCKPEFAAAALEDLRWLGIEWAGEPVFQSRRRALYLEAWRKLRDGGWIYPCSRSRKDVAEAALAPHEEESIFPAAWRAPSEEAAKWENPEGINWRFRVPDGETIRFTDGNFGGMERTALHDFGDFLVWNWENVPAYEQAVVVDDAAMGITEVVRGADLLTSTARQLLLYRALGLVPPAFFHCPLLCDVHGRRLAKRNDALSIRALREQGWTPERVLAEAAENVSFLR